MGNLVVQWLWHQTFVTNPPVLGRESTFVSRLPAENCWVSAWMGDSLWVGKPSRQSC